MFAFLGSLFRGLLFFSQGFEFMGKTSRLWSYKMYQEEMAEYLEWEEDLDENIHEALKDADANLEDVLDNRKNKRKDKPKSDSDEEKSNG